MPFILLALAVLVGGYILLKWIQSLDSVSLARALKYFSLIGSLIAILLMILTGRMVYAFFLLLVLLSIGMGWYKIKYRQKVTRRSKTRNHLQVRHMTLEEAYEILNLPKSATQKEVMAAFRKLMGKLHPDKGGSAYLTSQLIEAKDLILDHLNN